MEAVKRYGILTVGSVVLGISDYMFKFQNHFSFGGVSGIAVIMRGLLGGSASTYTFVINMLLLVVAFILLGKEVAMQSAYVSVLYSVTLEVIQYVWPMSKPLTNQPVLELVFCFMILAVCSAIFFDMNASSGGIGYYCFDIKKVYQCFNRNSAAGRRFHSCHCGIFRVWCNCRVILTGRIPCEVIFY